MDNSKRCGFTLSEILMALAIVGVIGLLIIPGTVRGMQNKAKVALLKNTVANIGTAIKTELVKNRTSDITLTDIYKDPKTFLQAMDLSSKSGSPFAESYKNYSGSAATVDIPSNSTSKQGAVRLKSGVSVGIINDDTDNTTSLVVDLTGPDKPNIVGADLFIMSIAREDGDGHSSGDIIFQAPNCNSDYATSCKNGDGASCFALVVRSSYDEDYLSKEIACVARTANGYKIGKRSDPKTWEAFKITTPMTKADCESKKASLGITNCRADDNDYWAAAVEECGGVQNMLTEDDLKALAQTIYPTCNNNACSGGLDSSKVPENLSGLGSGDFHQVWTNYERDNNSATVWEFNSSGAVKEYKYSRTNYTFRTVCISDL